MGSDIIRSVWDWTHYGKDPLCLNGTSPKLEWYVPYGITFTSGPIWSREISHTSNTLMRAYLLFQSLSVFFKKAWLNYRQLHKR